MPTVVLVGTLDTKGQEYAYLADRIREHGVDVVLVDAGIVGEPLATPDVTREEVAAAAGADVRDLAAAGDRGVAVETMGRGAAAVVQAAARGGQARRDRRPRRLRRLVARHLRDAPAADRRAEADGLDRRLRRHEPVRRLGRRDDDVLRRRHRRHQPDLGADPDERRRRARRHGEGDGAAARRGAAADRGLDVRRHDRRR